VTPASRRLLAAAPALVACALLFEGGNGVPEDVPSEAAPVAPDDDVSPTTHDDAPRCAVLVAAPRWRESSSDEAPVVDDIFGGTPASPTGLPFGVTPEPGSSGSPTDSAGRYFNDGSDGDFRPRVASVLEPDANRVVDVSALVVPRGPFRAEYLAHWVRDYVAPEEWTKPGRSLRVSSDEFGIVAEGPSHVVERVGFFLSHLQEIVLPKAVEGVGVWCGISPMHAVPGNLANLDDVVNGLESDFVPPSIDLVADDAVAAEGEFGAPYIAPRRGSGDAERARRPGRRTRLAR
jgi:hypothetical protein